MSSSLANLANNLNSPPLTNILKEQYPNLTDDSIKRKGIFPYSYLDTIEKLQESSFPSLEAFEMILLPKSAVKRTTDLLQKLGRSSTAKHLVII